jgi:hypothetical protein
MPYHSKGLGNNKAIKKERKKPLPLELMKNEPKRTESTRRSDEENPYDSETI